MLYFVSFVCGSDEGPLSPGNCTITVKVGIHTEQDIRDVEKLIRLRLNEEKVFLMNFQVLDAETE